ncbi:MAG: SDR family NAD(P)-dependent oxidoreductase [Anaerolineae bacterium]
MEPAGGRGIIVYGDVLDTAVSAATAEQVIKEFGRIDILINGAGGKYPRATTNPAQTFFDLPQDALQARMD